jgi:hypothetical protein
MKLQSQSRSLGASDHLQAWCALVAPHQAPGWNLPTQITIKALLPVLWSAPSPIPRVSLIAETPLNLHRRFLSGGFLQTAVSDAPPRE